MTMLMPAMFLIVATTVVMSARNDEKKLWNNGQCGKCNHGSWKSFDVDSQGDTGYKCTHCGNSIWISWKFEK